MHTVDKSLDFQIVDRVELPDNFLEMNQNEVVEYLTRKFTNQFYASMRPAQILIRRPDEDRITTSNTQWHQGPKTYEWLAFWSNMTPTELQLPDGTITKAKPFEVALINNHRVYHRASPETVAEVNPNRWFVQMACFIETTKLSVKVYKFSFDHSSDAVPVR